jgi:dihydrofolate reductase
MRKVVLYIAMSLDGYIADSTGGVGWLVGDGTDATNPGSYHEFYPTVDTVIMGYATYHQIITELSPGEWVYAGKTCVVISHNKPATSDDIVFTDQKLDTLLKELRNKDGNDIWICGGASIVNQLIAYDLIDRYWITVIPTILGRGVRLFANHDKETPLKLISTRSYNGMTDLIYERRN